MIHMIAGDHNTVEGKPQESIQVRIDWNILGNMKEGHWVMAQTLKVLCFPMLSIHI